MTEKLIRLWIALHFLGRPDYPDPRFRVSFRRAWQIATVCREFRRGEKAQPQSQRKENL